MTSLKQPVQLSNDLKQIDENSPLPSNETMLQGITIQ